MKYGVKLAVILVIVVLIAAIGSAVRAGLAGPIENGGGAMSMPIQKAASSVANWLEGIYGYLYEYDQLLEENNALRAENTELKERARDYDDIKEENDRLYRLLELREKRSDFVFEAARLVSWDASNYVSSFTISKGSTSGIELGDSVVTEYGALAGQICELGDTWATVRTIVDVEMDVGAYVGENSYAGMVVGEYSLMQQGKTRMTYLASGAQIFAGDEVLTSGRGGAFPPGLLIGEVETVMSEAGGQTIYGVVEPACELDRLTQVFVITDYDVSE